MAKFTNQVRQIAEENLNIFLIPHIVFKDAIAELETSTPQSTQNRKEVIKDGITNIIQHFVLSNISDKSRIFLAEGSEIAVETEQEDAKFYKPGFETEEIKIADAYVKRRTIKVEVATTDTLTLYRCFNSVDLKNGSIKVMEDGEVVTKPYQYLEVNNDADNSVKDAVLVLQSKRDKYKMSIYYIVQPSKSYAETKKEGVESFQAEFVVQSDINGYKVDRKIFGDPTGIEEFEISYNTTDTNGIPTWTLS